MGPAKFLRQTIQALGFTFSIGVFQYENNPPTPHAQPPSPGANWRDVVYKLTSPVSFPVPDVLVWLWWWKRRKKSL